MPKLAKALTDTQILRLQPREKSYKLSDGKCLYLLIHPSGRKYWRMSYRRSDKESTLSGGTYPEVSLSSAREWRNAMQKLIDAGVNPNERKQEQRKQIQPSKSITPKLKFIMNDHAGMTIETYSNRVILSEVQVIALKAFLNAMPISIQRE